MKKADLVKMILGVVFVIALVILCRNVDLQAVTDWFTSLTTKVEVADAGNQLDTPTVMPSEGTATPTPAPEATQEVNTVFTDENGKTYFVNSEEEAYQNVSLQGRLDYAEIVNYHVYDVLVDGDEIVKDATGNEITSRYGISLDEVESVAFLRDGYSMLTYSYDEGEFREDYSESHAFKGAKDKLFTSEVLCTEHHASIKATTRVGYINASLWGLNGQYGCKGNFEVKFLDGRIFDAIVLVKRAVVVNGTAMDAYTWCMRTCSNDQVKEPADGGNGNGGNKPSDKPTVEPTVKPTHSPTEAPTTAPTEAPTTAPTIEPTVKPTHSPTEPPRPTHSPTEAPTAAPTEAPTKEPTQEPSYKPTPVPEVTPEPTNRHSPTDEGSGNSHSPTDDGSTTDDSTSGGNRHSDASDSGTSNGNRHSEP